MYQRLIDHEIGLIELFSLTRELFRKNKTPLFLITVCVFFPLNILSEVINYLMLGTIQNINALMANPGLIDQFINSGQFQGILFYAIICLIIFYIFEPVGTMAIAIGVKKAVFEKKYDSLSLESESQLDWKFCIKKAISHGIYIVPASLLYFFAITFGISFFALPGIFFAVVWFFHPYAIALSDQKALSSLTYSGSLVQGRFFRTLIDLSAFFILNNILSYAVGSLFALGGTNFLFDVLGNFVMSSISCILVTAYTLYYLNREYIVTGKIYQEDPQTEQSHFIDE